MNSNDISLQFWKHEEVCRLDKETTDSFRFSNDQALHLRGVDEALANCIRHTFDRMGQVQLRTGRKEEAKKKDLNK